MLSNCKKWIQSDCVSFSANAQGKSINLSILPKYVGKS